MKLLFRSRLVLLSILLACNTSCSVKEDRWHCPCHLIFQVPREADLNRDGAFTLTVFEGGEKELSQSFSWRSVRDEDYIASVSKGEKMMSIILNKEDQFISGSSLLIKEGGQADSIYASSLRASCTDDTYLVHVKPEKQYASLHMVLKGYRIDSFPFSARLQGKICGMDLLSLQPIGGNFDYIPEYCGLEAAELGWQTQKEMKERGYDEIWDCSEVRFIVRIPRLKGDDDEEMVLKLNNKTYNVNNLESVSLSLSNIISRTGYDWSGEALEDIYLSFDIVSSEGLVAVREWASGWSGSITI